LFDRRLQPTTRGGRPPVFLFFQIVVLKSVPFEPGPLSLRWIIATVGWVALLIVYAVWKDIEKHIGGGFITGFLRGVIVFAGAYYLYKWAKNENHQSK